MQPNIGHTRARNVDEGTLVYPHDFRVTKVPGVVVQGQSYYIIVRCNQHLITNTVSHLRNLTLSQSHNCILTLSSVHNLLCPYIANYAYIDVQSVNQSITQSNASTERGGAPGEIRTRDLLITSQPL